MSSISYVYDIERQAGLGVGAFQQTRKILPGIRDRAGQGCFLCLESPTQEQYAVLVPCLRPSKARQVLGRLRVSTESTRLIYDKTMPWDNACESDSDIFRRLVDTCYQYLGWWKRWLPYYGVTEVIEVNVRLNTSCR